MLPDFRIYIDESGSSGTPTHPNLHWNQQYLGVTGVLIRHDNVKSLLHPAMELIKTRTLGQHPDHPIVFHRSEIMNHTGHFLPLKNTSTRARFDRQVLHLLRTLPYVVITAVIDKQRHIANYPDAATRWNPYTFCLDAILSRFTRSLRRRNLTADVMAESRGKKEDTLLRSAYSDLYHNGNFCGISANNLPASHFHATLTSSKLKCKKKSRNIDGLQVADMLANPSLRDILSVHGKAPQLAQHSFGYTLMQLLRLEKYDRQPHTGRVAGWGTVML